MAGPKELMKWTSGVPGLGLLGGGSGLPYSLFPSLFILMEMVGPNISQGIFWLQHASLCPTFSTKVLNWSIVKRIPQLASSNTLYFECTDCIGCALSNSRRQVDLQGQTAECIYQMLYSNHATTEHFEGGEVGVNGGRVYSWQFSF